MVSRRLLKSGIFNASGCMTENRAPGPGYEVDRIPPAAFHPFITVLSTFAIAFFGIGDCQAVYAFHEVWSNTHIYKEVFEKCRSRDKKCEMQI